MDDSRSEAFVRSLQPLSAYELRVGSVNAIGQSDWSNVLTLLTEEEGG